MYLYGVGNFETGLALGVFVFEGMFVGLVGM